MLKVAKMIASAEEALGWPYVSPGTNDANGIDCSGLFVKIYRDQGSSIYHGSNTIYRKYCGEKGELKNANQLVPGMAVFKWNPNTPSKYDDGLGDFQHIGLVVSVNPLRIIHASSAAGCVTTDTKIGKWKYWGKLKDVDYSGSVVPDPEPIPKPEPEPETKKIVTVVSENGKPVNMRTKAYLTAPLVDRVDCGTRVYWLKDNGNGWSYIQFGKKYGWMMSKFLSGGEEQVSDPGEPSEGFPILRKGDRGSYVTLLQTKLLMYGYEVGNVDGIFGKKTESAVKEFQANVFLNADGIVSEDTWNKLMEGDGADELFTVTIRHLHNSDAVELKEKYGSECITVIRE